MSKENPFVKAEKKQDRLKILLWGPPGSGKTTTALTFPNPVVIDMEGGTNLYGNDFEFGVMHASTPEEVEQAVKWLLTNNHDYKTLVLDPITVYWEALQKKWSDIFLSRNEGGKGFKHEFYDMQIRDWNVLKSEHKSLLRLLYRLDMNVIATAHQRDESDRAMNKVGTTYDGMKKIDYAFDTIVNMWRQPDGTYMVTATGGINKDRTHCLPDGPFQVTPGSLAGKFAKMNLTGSAKKIVLASKEQLDRLETYRVMFQLTPEKWSEVLSRNCGTTENDEVSSDDADTLLAKFDAEHEKRQTKKETANAESQS